MTSVKKKLWIFSSVIFVVTFALTVLRGVALFAFYEADIGYFQRGEFLPEVYNYISVLALVLSALFALLVPREGAKALAAPSFDLPFVKTGSVFALCGTATYLFYLFLGVLGDTEIYKKTNTSGMLEALALIVGCVSLFYFLCILTGKTGKSNYYVIFSYAMIIFLLLALSFTYFDYFTVMNGPNKLLLQVTVLVFMLYLITEQRYAIGIAKPRAYFGLCLAALYFTFSCSLPYIAAFLFGKVTNVAFLFYHFMIFGFAVYVSSRLFAFLSAPESKK